MTFRSQRCIARNVDNAAKNPKTLAKACKILLPSSVTVATCCRARLAGDRSPNSSAQLKVVAMSRNWKFCPYSGALLDMEPAKGTATCAVSGYTRNLSGTYGDPALAVPWLTRLMFLGLAELENVTMVTHTDMEVGRAACFQEAAVLVVSSRGRRLTVTSAVCLVGVQKAIQLDSAGQAGYPR